MKLWQKRKIMKPFEQKVSDLSLGLDRTNPPFQENSPLNIEKAIDMVSKDDEQQEKAAEGFGNEIPDSQVGSGNGFDGKDFGESTDVDIKEQDVETSDESSEVSDSQVGSGNDFDEKDFDGLADIDAKEQYVETSDESSEVSDSQVGSGNDFDEKDFDELADVDTKEQYVETSDESSEVSDSQVGSENDFGEQDFDELADVDTKEQSVETFDESGEISDSQVEDTNEIEEPENKDNSVSSLKKIKNRFSEYLEKKQGKIKTKTEESDSDLLQQLSELKPYFERETGDGFSLEIDDEKVPDSLIRTLIVKFLNQRFCNSSDLNVRSNSLEESEGFSCWDLGKIVEHMETEQITKIPYDKYGYRYGEGKHENIPLSFYFDMSGSMSKYSNLLANIAFELLKKGVKVLVGFNETIIYQFDWVNQKMELSEFAQIIQKGGNRGSIDKTSKDIEVKSIDQQLDTFLIDKKAEKCVVFSDFDPRRQVHALSDHASVYWFCFENEIDRTDTSEFHGFLYQVENEQDIAKGLIEVSEYRFQTLCRFQPKNYQKKK